MNYKEEIKAANGYREQYLNSMNDVISKLHQEAEEKRADYFETIREHPEEARKDFIKMLGWPLTEYSYTKVDSEEFPLVKEEDVRVTRVVLHLPIGLKFYGLHFEHDTDEKLPLVIAQHGGDGTAELCSGLFEGGSDNYNDMVMRIFKKGVNVFAPQLLIWRGDLHEIMFHRERMDARLKQVGSSMTAMEVYALRKCIDYLTSKPTVDPEKIGMAGLSYGGFYTLFTAAADTRIKAALSSCFYNNRKIHSWVDWAWRDCAYRFFDNEIASLVYPRRLLLEVGDHDSLFPPEPAIEEAKKLQVMWEDCSWFDFSVFDGEHEFNQTDENIDKLIQSLKNE